MAAFFLWQMVDDLMTRVVGIPPEFEFRFGEILKWFARDVRNDTLMEVERLLYRKRDEWQGERWKAVIELERLVKQARESFSRIEGDES